jgi:hypothetical protein
MDQSRFPQPERKVALSEAARGSDGAGATAAGPVDPEPHFVTFTRKGITIAERYFDDSAPDRLPKIDILRFAGVLSPNTQRRWRQTQTLLIDLLQSDEVLLEKMGKNTRYKIRRAMDRDRLAVEVFDTPTAGVLAEFCDYYDRFATSIGLRPIFRPRLELMSEAEMLTLTSVRDDSGAPLAWHAYVVLPPRSLLLHSASLYRDVDRSATRNMIGRANRYLHWCDMVHFKRAGHSAYDMGGIDVAGRTDETRRIGDFKLGFGGDVVPIHACVMAVSAKGRVAHALLRLRGIEF